MKVTYPIGLRVGQFVRRLDHGFYVQVIGFSDLGGVTYVNCRDHTGITRRFAADEIREVAEESAAGSWPGITT